MFSYCVAGGGEEKKKNHFDVIILHAVIIGSFFPCRLDRRSNSKSKPTFNGQKVLEFQIAVVLSLQLLDFGLVQGDLLFVFVAHVYQPGLGFFSDEEDYNKLTTIKL